MEFIDLLISQIQEGNKLAIALSVSGVCALASLWSLFFQYRVWNWPYTYGELLGSEVKAVGGKEWAKTDQDYHAVVDYRYQVNGIEYAGNRLSAMAMVASHNAKALLARQLKGVEFQEDQVKVYFNPENPKKSFLIRGSLTQVVVTLIGFGIFFSIAVQMYSRLT
jgi:Protein of unknown function (DUF3592)